jgi:putative FmdB family regulatory protein
MPLYEYRCDACGRKFELIQRFSDPPAESCAVCGSGPVHKLLSSPAFQFKGSGWYVTDYARKDQKSGAKTEPGGESAASKDSASESVKDKAESGEKSSAGDKSGGSEKKGGTDKRATPAGSPAKE